MDSAAADLATADSAAADLAAADAAISVAADLAAADAVNWAAAAALVVSAAFKIDRLAVRRVVHRLLYKAI